MDQPCPVCPLTNQEEKDLSELLLLLRNYALMPRRTAYNYEQGKTPATSAFHPNQGTTMLQSPSPNYKANHKNQGVIFKGRKGRGFNCCSN